MGEPLIETIDQFMFIIWVESAAHRVLGCRHKYGRQFRAQHKPEGRQAIADDVPQYRRISPPEPGRALSEAAGKNSLVEIIHTEHQ